MTSKTQLAAKIYRLMVEPTFTGSSFTGGLVVSAESRQLTQELAAADMVLEDVCQGLADGAKVLELEVSVPRGRSGFVAADWDDLLRSYNFRVKQPEEFFIVKEVYLSSEQKSNTLAERYGDTIAFTKLLQDIADFNDISENKTICIFLLPAKLEVELSYTSKDLRAMPGLKDLADEFGASAKKHKDQRRMILKVVLDEMLSAVKSTERFPSLLKSFQDFKRRVRDSYDLYVAEFSFEKVLEEVNAHKLDYTIKLNKVFSDIQNQLLAVPAALVLIGGQLKDVGRIDWHNVIIMFGCLVFVVFMNLLIRNQHHTLEAVHSEILAQEDNWVKQHQEIYERFSRPYAELDKRYLHQKRLIKTFDALVAATFLIATVLFCWYSTPPSYWLKTAILEFF